MVGRIVVVIIHSCTCDQCSKHLHLIWLHELVAFGIHAWLLSQSNWLTTNNPSAPWAVHLQVLMIICWDSNSARESMMKSKLDAALLEHAPQLTLLLNCRFKGTTTHLWILFVRNALMRLHSGIEVGLSHVYTSSVQAENYGTTDFWESKGKLSTGVHPSHN